MTKKKPVSLAPYYRKNQNWNFVKRWLPDDSGMNTWIGNSYQLHKQQIGIDFEVSERIRLASMLVQRAEAAKFRTERRREKEAEQRRHLTRFLVAVGGQELLIQYQRSHTVGVTWEGLGIARHPDYDKKYGIDSTEEE